jgi:putative ABC transport system ATP-binding protein
MTDIILETKQLSVEIRETKILYDISSKIKNRIVTAIIGKSGSGKSTFLKAIVKLVSSSGEVILYDDSGGVQTIYSVVDLRRQVIYLPQVPAVFPGTVEDNLKWANKIWDINPSQQDLKDILDLVNLEENILSKDASDLSVGQQQRVALGRVLILNPRVLLLDEPTASLDAISRESLNKSIKEIVEKQKTAVILITHSLEQAFDIADEIILLHDGKLIAQKPKNEFFNLTFQNGNKYPDLPESDILQKLLDNYGGGN